MKAKEFVVGDHTAVTIIKRSSSRHVRLSISPNGQVKVSIPAWLPYKVGIDFAKSKQKWIESQRPEQTLLTDGQSIGKNHHLRFMATSKNTITTRLSDVEAIVFIPDNFNSTDAKIQLAAKRVAKKALLSQGNMLLPLRLRQLADKYDYKYNQIKIKSLKTRWGSCDSHQNITLNLFLMLLPWELIDYVIIHELNHTVIMQHGPKFWNLMQTKLPNVNDLRKQIKSYKPII
jgi:predicted metal-dependent hydrolase